MSDLAYTSAYRARTVTIQETGELAALAQAAEAMALLASATAKTQHFTTFRDASERAMVLADQILHRTTGQAPPGTPS